VQNSRGFMGLAAMLALLSPMHFSFRGAPVAGKSGTQAKQADRKQIDRGRYMTIVGGCNDCHTAGFAPRRRQSAGKRTG